MPLYEHPVNLKDPELRLLIPSRALNLVPSAVDEEETVIHFAKDDSHLFFGAGQRVITVRQLAGQFPNYQQVIPQDLPIPVECDRAEFIRTLRRAALFADERTHNVKLEISEKSLRVSAHSDAGSYADKLAINPTGISKKEPLIIGFNLLYLIDFLTRAETERVVLNLQEPKCAGKMALVPEKEAQLDYRYEYVIMPMSV
jgi:DNA polymerase III subunit beta